MRGVAFWATPAHTLYHSEITTCFSQISRPYNCYSLAALSCGRCSAPLLLAISARRGADFGFA
ncbi:hypothetical protein D3C78_1507830 [compost metagenome]